MTKLLLASKSPRRRELLATLGIPFAVVDINVDEHFDVLPPADKVAESLAERKSEGYGAHLQPDEILVTADTVVVLDNQVLGKPHDRLQAVTMLKALSGHTHYVYTGVCLRSDAGRRLFTECTKVCFRALSDEDIAYYVDNFKPYDKAGAYGIQEWIGMVGVERIEGCFYNVMGLPVGHLYKELKRLVD